METKAVVLVGVFSAASICGFVLGRTTSPDSSNPETAAIYLALYGKWKHVDPDDGELTLDTPGKVYRFRHGFSAVQWDFKPYQLENRSMPRRDFQEDVPKFLEMAVAPASSGILATLLVKDPEGLAALSVPKKGLIFVGIALTGAVGYWLGHRSNPDIDDEKFQKNIKDQELWSRLNGIFEHEYIQSRQLAFGIIFTHFEKNPYQPELIFMRKELLEHLEKMNKSEKAFHLRHREILDELASDPLLTAVATESHITMNWADSDPRR